MFNNRYEKILNINNIIKDYILINRNKKIKEELLNILNELKTYKERLTPAINILKSHSDFSTLVSNYRAVLNNLSECVEKVDIESCRKSIYELQYIENELKNEINKKIKILNNLVKFIQIIINKIESVENCNKIDLKILKDQSNLSTLIENYLKVEEQIDKCIKESHYVLGDELYRLLYNIYDKNKISLKEISKKEINKLYELAERNPKILEILYLTLEETGEI